ncbi:MAG: alpha/beta fold hydrolase [Anaerolineae bacterium]|nr:alpha/beta hydrolase [Caldilineales bacterium]MCX7851368.1 alpha/beta hydrolase [Caldilineales bacterium]MDW8268425.1 alpha/beta fold hydrolase [Anaerolineae bacterium]
MIGPFSFYSPPSRYARVSDVRIHYRVLGAGEPLVMLHGLGSAGSDWFPVTPGLAPYYRLVLVDLRGHGQSSLARDYSIAAMARDVKAVLDAEGIGQTHVLGLSLGGCVALQLAIAAPARVMGLVLVNTFARLRHEGMWRRRLARVRYAALGSMDDLARLVAGSLFGDPAAQALAFDRLRRNDLGAIRRCMMAVARFDVRRQLSQITAPTLVLIGDRDRTVPRRCADELAAGIPHARLQVIADAGHALPHEQPEAFTRAVLAFLAATSETRQATVEPAG